jgi:glycogen debranching enzyme
LKKRFDERLSMPDLRYFALALEADASAVKTMASNAGLCAARGIVDDNKARAVVDRLMAPDIFSGSGFCMPSSDHPAFDPFASHL